MRIHEAYTWAVLFSAFVGHYVIISNDTALYPPPGLSHSIFMDAQSSAVLRTCISENSGRLNLAVSTETRKADPSSRFSHDGQVIIIIIVMGIRS